MIPVLDSKPKLLRNCWHSCWT